MTILYLFKELIKISLIYCIAFIIYYYILVGFKKGLKKRLKKGFEDIINFLYKIVNFVFPVIIITMVCVSAYTMFQQISVGIALFSLSISICTYFINTSKELSKDNLHYYSKQIEQLDKIKNKKLITSEEYDKQIEILKKDFEKNKIKILK